MAWTLEFSTAARKKLRDMDRVAAQRIVRFLTERVATSPDPRSLGEALKGSKYDNQWRYRVGDYRVITEIKDSVVTILVVQIGHRGDVYR